MCNRNKNDLVIVAETAFNHEGDIEYLYNLIDSAAQSGVSHIKFQVLIDYDSFVSKKSESYQLVKSWCFTEEQWLKVFDYVESLGLKLFLMPLCCESVRLCKRASVEYIEIHSVSFYDLKLVSNIVKILGKKTIAFGIGGRTVEELTEVLAKFGNKNICFICGFQAYPSELKDVKLSRIKYLSTKYPDLLLGYADHSAPTSNDAYYSSHYAYLLGARLFEKHITLEKNRTDSQSAFTVEEMKFYISDLKRVSSYFDEKESSSFDLSKEELVYRNRQKKVVANKYIRKGEQFKKENLGLKMHTEDGVYTSMSQLIGKIANKNYDEGDIIC